jgi:signal transduction histidine kinase
MLLRQTLRIWITGPRRFAVRVPHGVGAGPVLVEADDSASPRWRRGVAAGYGAAVAGNAAAVALTVLLGPLARENPLLLFHLPVIAAAWLGGVRPALLATLLAAILTGHFFVASADSPPGALTARNLRLALFLIEGTLVGLLGERLREVRRRYRELDGADREKDHVLSTVAHELRAPLQALIAWTGVLRRTRDEATRAGVVHRIERSLGTQARLVQDLLDASRIAGGKLRLRIETVDPARIAAETVDDLEEEFRQKELRVEVRVDPAAGAVRADADRLRQVLCNLLSNAIRFTPRGGRVDVFVERGDRIVRIHVRDDGEGIRPELLPHVFERFRQSERSARLGGLGLGLAVAREIVELHGGTISAESPGPGRGSTFTIEIPASPPAQR